MLSPGDGRAARRRGRATWSRSPAGDRRVEAPVLVVPGHADDAVTLPLGYGRTGAGQRRQRAWASTPARCGPATRPGSTAAPTVTNDRRPPPARPSPRTTGRWRPTGAIPPPAVDAPLAEVLDDRLEVPRGAGRAPRPAADHPRARSTTASSSTSGAWRSTSTSAPAATPASSPARRRTTSRSSARSRSRAAARCTGSASTATSAGRLDEPEIDHPAARLRALRDRALRVRLPGQRHRPQRRGPERDGLQPLHRHPLLQQQLPVQGAALQLPRLHRRRHRGARRWRCNPDVTVRAPRRHGEVHLLRAAHRAQAHRHPHRGARRSRDGEIETACQQACPTEAIVFGIAQRPELARSPSCTPDARRYDLLHELGTRPRTAYLARVRNPNPELA